MDEHLESLLDTLEIICEGACFAYKPYGAWPEIEKKIQEIKEYIKVSSRCSNENHHTAGYDCCN
jgi:hypothetical protein